MVLDSARVPFLHSHSNADQEIRELGLQYGEEYFASHLGPPYAWSEPHWPAFFGRIAQKIVDRLGPCSVLDAGCAIGFLVGALRERGVEAEGIDVSEYAIGQAPAKLGPYCRVASVTAELPRSYDLIVCIEVLEHLPPRHAERAIRNFAAHADAVLFSSTPTDDREPTHVNVRPVERWVELFAREGLHRDLQFDASFVTPHALLFRRSRRGERLAAHLSPARNMLRRGLKAAWWTATLQLPRRLRERREATERASRPATLAEQYDAWLERYDTLTTPDLNRIRGMVAALTQSPLVSVVMPVCDPPARYLHEAIASVQAQAYDRWELCIADDASTDPTVRALLDGASEGDPRVKVVRRSKRGGISASLNSALAAASGELVAFLDHDDVLPAHALFMVAHTIERYPETAVLYSDEDKIDDRGRRSEPYFKPDWNPALLLGQNYLSHFLVCRRDVVLEACGFRPAFDGAQDWDLALRLTGKAGPRTVRHVPHVLYHRRRHAGSTASAAAAKPYAQGAGRRAVEDHLRTTGTPGSARSLPSGWNRLSYALPAAPPRVDVLIPSALSHEDVVRCLESVLRHTSFPSFAVTLAVTESDAAARARIVPANDPRLELFVYPDRLFNYSWVVNAAVARSSADIVCLLNDDVEVIHSDWLDALVARALLPGVGAVGALLYYPDDTVQHAGVIVGPGGVAAHYHAGLERHAMGYFGRAALDQDLSAVTAACMVVRRDAFEAAGGFDETLAVAFNDVDFCLKLGETGRRIVWTPCAELYHRESTSVGPRQWVERREQFNREVALMRDRWGDRLAADPHYNPNLSLDHKAMNTLAFPPRADYPWRNVSAARTSTRAAAEQRRGTGR